MGGKSQPKAPDYTALADASAESAAIMAGLGQKQLDANEKQFQAMLPFMQGISEDQRAMMKQQMEQAKGYYDYSQKTFRPIEEKMAADALGFNTDAKREELAQQAAADAGQAFATTQAANERGMASMGVNPNSGRFAGQQRASELGLAAVKANAMTGTRRQAEQLGWARQLDATGLGRGLAGASSGAYAGAVGAGNAAGANAQSPYSNYQSGMAAGVGTMGNAQNMYLSGLNNSLAGQSSIYQSQMSRPDPTMQLLGMAGGLMMSSKDYKTDKRPVDAQEVSRKVEGIPVDRWKYKPEVVDDDAKHTGPYAEDMQKLGAATPDGKAIDVISALGLNLAAIKGLGQRISKLEQANG